MRSETEQGVGLLCGCGLQLMCKTKGGAAIALTRSLVSKRIMLGRFLGWGPFSHSIHLSCRLLLRYQQQDEPPPRRSSSPLATRQSPPSSNRRGGTFVTPVHFNSLSTTISLVLQSFEDDWRICGCIQMGNNKSNHNQATGIQLTNHGRWEAGAVNQSELHSWRYSNGISYTFVFIFLINWVRFVALFVDRSLINCTLIKL